MRLYRPAVWVIAVLSLVAGRAGAADTSTTPKPNFVFILSDDQDWTGTSVQMHPDIPGSRSEYIQTPHLEKLAAEGMRFSNAYAPSPVCSPTRYSLQTGKSPARHGWTKAAPVVTVTDNFRMLPPSFHKSLPDKEITVAELLRKAGYATAHYGKWHLSGGGPGAHGYDEHDGDTGNRDAESFGEPNPVDIFGISRRAADFMAKQAKADKPFYVQLSHHALHYPEQSLKATQEKYEKLRGSAHWDITRAAMAENLDTGVGMVMSAIDRLDIADHTYLIYMSDNGGGGGGSKRRPITGGKGSLWEGGIRVPLLIRGPGIEPETICDEPVLGTDLLPTFCELAGIRDQIPATMDGGSLVPLLTAKGKGQVARPHDGLVFHFPHYQGRPEGGPCSAIRLGDFKLLKFYEDDSLCLFNLSKDIAERRNLAEQMPEKTADLRRRLETYLQAVGANMPTANPDYDPNRPSVQQKGVGKKGKDKEDRGGRRGKRKGLNRA